MTIRDIHNFAMIIAVVSILCHYFFTSLFVEVFHCESWGDEISAERNDITK
jgi:hypothetical protein